MESKNLLKVLVLTGWLFSPLSSVFSHDPGLSRSSVRLQGAGLTIKLVFARQDLEILALIDANYDGTVTVDEFDAAQDDLGMRFASGVDVRHLGEIVFPTVVLAEQVPDDAVNIELSYNTPKGSAVSVHIPLIAQLSRGHRQYMAVHDETGNLHAQHILSVASPPVFLDAQVLLNGGGPSWLSVLRAYLLEGIWHIWIGFDHILFLLTLLLPAVLVYRRSRWQSVDSLRPAVMDTLRIATAFTVAHSITLALAVLEIVSLPPRLVESAIALSVLVTALNNLRPVFPTSRWLLAFGFGLVHGFGFAGVLVNLGLPGDALAISLLGFNLGVEIGQLAIVACVFPVIALLRHTRLYRTWMFGGGSTVAAIIATVWIFERILDYKVLGF